VLKIRRAQLDALRLERHRPLLGRIVERLRRDLAAELAGTPDDELERTAGAGLCRALGYGIETEPELEKFVSLLFLVAPDFDEHPFVAAILRDESIPPAARLGTLLTACPRDVWDEAAERWRARRRREGLGPT